MAPADAVLYGQILDLSGQPVEGAAVRVSGGMNPVIYDKTERMVVLKDCPTAVTDEEGRYRLAGFATEQQMVSIHVNIDCVLRMDRKFKPGEHVWSPRVQAGHWVKGKVVDGNGDGIAKAVVSGGGNWTPTNPDGTYWLDNIEEGPFELEVVHHGHRRTTVAGVVAGLEDFEVVLAEPLPTIRLRVTAADTGEALDLITITWAYAPPGPHRFVPVSPDWHAKEGVFAVTVPENATAATVWTEGREPHALDADALRGGSEHEIALAPATGESPR